MQVRVSRLNLLSELVQRARLSPRQAVVVGPVVIFNQQVQFWP